MELTHKFVQTNGITLHVVTAGPVDGPPVVLLHGFPEFWYGWHNQIPYLAAQGYRVIAPDQRGYNLSDKPRGAANYQIDELARDVVGLIDALGYATVFLAGHDWGAAVAWWLVTHYPERLRKLAILNVPYPTLMRQAAQTGNWRQALRSWYIYFFQLPWLPEQFLRLTGRTARNILSVSSRRDTFTAADLDAYRQAWSQPGALTGMVNWYRAALRLFTKTPTPPPGGIQTPTLMLWGERDVALGKELAQPSIDLCANGRLIFYPKATHWVQHDAAAAVNTELAHFFATP
jgi:epoxide hydrolase 4